MPAIGNIVVNDAVPAAHTFGPAGILGSKASYADRAGGIPIGYNTMDISLRQPNMRADEPVYVVTLNTKCPTLEVTSPSTASGIQPAPTVAYSHNWQTVGFLPIRGTLQNRKDSAMMHKNALASAAFISVYENQEAVY